jgi:hypothetical protein
MSSDKKREANRRNGQQSRGPTTLEGKARASVNALKNGLFTARLLPGENDVYCQLVIGLANHFRPVGVLEQSLVRQIALDMLRLMRFEVAEYAYLQGAAERRKEGPVFLTEPSEQDLLKVKAYIEKKLVLGKSPKSESAEKSHVNSPEYLEMENPDLLDWHVRALEGVAPVGQGGTLTHLYQSKRMIEGDLHRKIKLLVALQERRITVEATAYEDDVPKPSRNVAKRGDKPNPLNHE